MSPPAAAEDGVYEPKDALGAGLRGTGVGATAGFFAAAIANALATRNVGALGVFTRSGSTILTLAVSAGTFEFVRTATANLRGKNDHWSTTVGAATGGALLGIRTRQMPAVVGIGAFMGVTLGLFEFTGGRLEGWAREQPEDEYERKLKARQNRRRPIEETIAEVGEGRGIYPPGYEERRRQRLKEKYGFDVNPVKATVD